MAEESIEAMRDRVAANLDGMRKSAAKGAVAPENMQSMRIRRHGSVVLYVQDFVKMFGAVAMLIRNRQCAVRAPAGAAVERRDRAG